MKELTKSRFIPSGEEPCRETRSGADMEKKKVNGTASVTASLLSACLCLFGGAAVFTQAVGEGVVAYRQPGAIKGTIEARAPRYRENTVVYIDHVAGDFLSPQENPMVDQKNFVFLPHVTVITKGTTIDFRNSDNEKHDVFSPSPVADDMDLGAYKGGEVRSWTFNNIGEAVLLCNIHAEMEAWVVIRQTPYFAVADKEGNFEIRDIPAGRYTLKTWNKKYSGPPQEVTVKEGETIQVSLKVKKKKRR
jgi:plastocyanin